MVHLKMVITSMSSSGVAGSTPAEWSVASVVCLHKKGQTTEVAKLQTNYHVINCIYIYKVYATRTSGNNPQWAGSLGSSTLSSPATCSTAYLAAERRIEEIGCSPNSTVEPDYAHASLSPTTTELSMRQCERGPSKRCGWHNYCNIN